MNHSTQPLQNKVALITGAPGASEQKLPAHCMLLARA